MSDGIWKPGIYDHYMLEADEDFIVAFFHSFDFGVHAA